MSRLQELIAELCPDGVEYKVLGDVAVIERGASPRPIKQCLTDSEHGVPWIKIGDAEASGKYILSTAEFITIDASKKSRFLEAGSFVLSNSMSYGKPYILGIDGCIHDGWLALRNYEHNFDKSFLYYLLLSDSVQRYWDKKVNSSSVSNLNSAIVRDTPIPVPPIEVQREVVRILDEYTAAHDELVRQLEEEVSLREQQLSIARNELFMPNDVENVAWVPLGELAEIGTGSHDTKDAIEGGKYVFYARGVDPLSLDEFDFDEVAIITAGDGAGVGKVFHYVDGKYALHQRAYRIHPVVKSILPKYLLHYFKATFYPYIMRSAVSSSVTSIRRRMLDNYMVPVPSLERQRLLVGRLDEMEALSNAMSSELQSQLSLEREQLALVRNQLLWFPEKVA